MTIQYNRFDSQYRNTPRAPEALALNQQATQATLISGLPALLTQLSSDVTSWSGNPTTLQAAIAVSDARAIACVVERIHSLTHRARGGA